ncbi:MAG: DUF4062 domain-containing protein, partial [Proteobacteria bacterium]|nr:DUF4062 domain-containing protein [Pseudomonadota bacterium]
MNANRRILKVFLGAPGDLQEERKAASRVVEEENRNHAHINGFQIELVGWEETIAQQGRPQAVINRDLEQCDYFVGIMWQRWGSPPGHLYSSGFEEEFCLSVERQEKTDKPEISLLFKTPLKDLLEDPGEQLTKVLSFKEKLIKE